MFTRVIQILASRDSCDRKTTTWLRVVGCDWSVATHAEASRLDALRENTEVSECPFVSVREAVGSFAADNKLSPVAKL